MSTTAFLLHLFSDTYRHEEIKYKKKSGDTQHRWPRLLCGKQLRQVVRSGEEKVAAHKNSELWVTFTFTLFLQVCCRVVHFYFSLNMWRNEKVKKGGDDRRVSVPRVILWNVQFVGSFLVKLCYTHTLIDIKMFTIVHYNHFSFAVFSHQSVLERAGYPLLSKNHFYFSFLYY